MGYNKEYARKYYLEHKEEDNERSRKYGATEKGKKCKRIYLWRSRGMLLLEGMTWEDIHDYYINTWECEDCGCELVSGFRQSNKRCLDHCHHTGYIRGVVCHKCNMRRPNASAVRLQELNDALLQYEEHGSPASTTDEEI